MTWFSLSLAKTSAFPCQNSVIATEDAFETGDGPLKVSELSIVTSTIAELGNIGMPSVHQSVSPLCL